jgi:hypothetical protein
MNYQNHAIFDNAPPLYGYEGEAFTDKGQGIPQMNANNMTVEDIYRTPFLFLQDHRKNFANMAPEALEGIQSGSELSKLFFSDENFKRLQRGIKAEVFKRTGGKFRLDVDQEQRELFLLMRSVYMQHARFLPGQIVRQVKRLNQKVITESVPDIITGIKQEYGYLKEINKPLSPIDRPMNVNNRGRKTLPCVCTTFGA